MTKATPQASTPAKAPAAAQPAAATPARATTPTEAAAKISNIMFPKAAAGDDTLSDEPVNGKKPPAKAKISTKAAPQQPKAKALETGDTADNSTDEGEAIDEAANDADLDDESEQAEGEVEGDELDDQASDDAEADEETEESDGKLHTVIVGGKEYEVPYEELIAGYQRNADYTQKSQALAKERKELEAVKESVKDLPIQHKAMKEAADRFAKNAVLTMTALETRFMPQEPAPELAKTDPAAYFAQKEKRAEAIQLQNALRHELHLAETQGKAMHARAVAESRKELYKMMPELQEAPARQKLRSYANSLGFSDEAIAQEANATLFVCVEKARRYDELMARKAELKPKAPLPKATKRSNAQPSARAVHAQQKKNVLDNHAKAKSVKSAEHAIAGLLNRPR